jgi:hypothetical protein
MTQFTAKVTLLKIACAISVIVTIIVLYPFAFQMINVGQSTDVAVYSHSPGSCTATPRDVSYSLNFPPDRFMSPISIKLLADAHYGSENVPHASRDIIDELRLERVIKCLEPGAVIFVDTTALARFFKLYLSLIDVPFVLISGDSDFSPTDIVDPETISKKFLGNGSLIIHWFGMNCANNLDSARFTCLMNGVSQWNQQMDVMREMYDLDVGIVNKKAPYQLAPRDRVAEKSDQYREHVTNVSNTAVTENITNQNTSSQHRIEISKPFERNNKNTYKVVENKNMSYSVLLSFNQHSNIAVRKPIWDYFCDNPQTASFTYCTYTRRSLKAIYTMIASSKFVLSPSGKGLDCYRTYESLYLGAYVVVLSGSLDEMYDNLPVLIVDSWHEVTENLLNETYHRFHNSVFDFDKLFTRYWYHKFRSFGYKPYMYRKKLIDTLTAAVGE